MKIVFFGSSNFALPILESLHAAHKILAVVTTPDLPAGRDQELKPNPVAELATKLGLRLLKPIKVKGDTELLGDLKSLAADIFIVSAYGVILPDEIIYLPKLKTLNTHPSLLPQYRGPSPIQNAIKDGLSQTGTSIMVLDSKMDTGPVLGQKECLIDISDNYNTLSVKLAKLSADLLIKILPDYQNGSLSPIPQDDPKATYTKIISKDDGRIDWNKSAEEIHNIFRAFVSWPGIWTTWEGKKIKVTDCQISQGRPVDQASTVLPDGVVACGQNTFLKINRLQLEGKKETDITSFLNGYKNFIGAKLK